MKQSALVVACVLILATCSGVASAQIANAVIGGKAYDVTMMCPGHDGDYYDVMVYWPGTRRIHYIYRYTQQDTWVHTIEYDTTGTIRLRKWCADTDPATPGNIVYEEYKFKAHEYPSKFRVIFRMYDTGEFVHILYYPYSSKIYRQVYFTNDMEWRMTEQYYRVRGTKMKVRYRWIADPQPSVFGDTVFMEFDKLGRIIRENMDNGQRKTITYWSRVSSEIMWEIYTDAYGNWIKTLKYYEDGQTLHYEWLTDLDKTNPGDIQYREYDSYGRLMKEQDDTGSSREITYFGESDNKFLEAYFGPGYAWITTIEYFDGTGNVHQEWIADADPSVTGDIQYREYDRNGRVVFEMDDTGSFHEVSYYGSGNDKYYEAYFGRGYTWIITVKYFEGANTVNEEWRADADPSMPGDVIYREYDLLGRMIKEMTEEGRFHTVNYYGESDNKYQEAWFGSGYTWERTVEYYEGTNIIHREWLEDPNPGSSGDMVYYEYDMMGNPTYGVYDDGTVWTPLAGPLMVQKMENDAIGLTELKSRMSKPGLENGITFTSEMAEGRAGYGLRYGA